MTDHMPSPFEQALAKASRALNATEEEQATLRRVAEAAWPDLPTFLLARIAEDEEVAKAAYDPDTFDKVPSYYSTFGPHQDDWGLYTFHVPVARVLAECDAKRRIVEIGACITCIAEDQSCECPDAALRALALPYADHPEYQEDWKP